MTSTRGTATLTKDITERLRNHYLKPGDLNPGGVFVTEVANNGNFGAGRRCDAIYAGFTNTSGRILIGHEIKVSRSDWLHELDQIHKSDQWADQCHEWWLVVPTATLVHDGELPDGWGLMVPKGRGRRFATVVQARRHTDRTPSWDTCRSILAREDTLRATAVREGIDKGIKDAAAKMEERNRAVRDSMADRGGDLAAVQALRQALGISIYWDRSAQEWLGRDVALIAPLAELLRTARDVEDARRTLREEVGATTAALRRVLTMLESSECELPELFGQSQ